MRHHESESSAPRTRRNISDEPDVPTPRQGGSPGHAIDPAAPSEGTGPDNAVVQCFSIDASTHRHIDPAMVAASRRFLKQLLDEPVRGLVRLYRPCNSIPKGHRWPTALTILTRSFPPAEAFVAR